MSSLKGTPILGQRGGALTNGSLSKRSQATVPSKLQATSGAHSTTAGRSIRTTPLRPTRTNTAVNAASPRKTSAPGKLFSAIGGSLDSLPDTVTVRRKVSTPAKVGGSALGTPKPEKSSDKKTPSKFAVKKSSAPAKIIPESFNSRISKDHGVSNTVPGSSSGKSGESSASKSTKKVFTSHADSSQGGLHKGGIASLPTVKEEKSATKSKTRKMSEPIQSYGKKKSANQPTHHHHPKLSASIDNLSTKTDDIVVVDADKSAADTLSEEKSELERMVSDLIKNNECKKQEIAALKMEINRLKESVRDMKQQLSSRSDVEKKDDVSINAEEMKKLQEIVDSLANENRSLRDHLQHLGVRLDASSLSDQQKELILSRVSSAFSQSGGAGFGGATGMEMTSSTATFDKEWDNKSSSSISEISVACLQGRIHQMEETHYSTSEELQATLQELEDLREQLSECQIDNHQLLEEKQVILESLTQQTEKLNESRSYNDTLKGMLIQQCENSQDVSQCEKTQRLVELLKNVQEDKELVQIKQEECDQQLHSSKEAEEHYHREARLIRERMKLLEVMVESATKDKKEVETLLVAAEEATKESQRESDRFKISLSSAKEKITELEAAVVSGEKSEMADMLDSVRYEKENLDKEITSLHKKFNLQVSENERLKDQIAGLQDTLRVTRNNAKTNLDDVEWKRSQLDDRRVKLVREMDSLKATISETQMTCQRHLEDKRELKANLNESQKKHAEMIERQLEIERNFAEERVLFSKQVEEWEQFQKDLLTSVRVANDFKTEAQHNLERFQQENLNLKERLRQLDIDLEKAKATTKQIPSPANNTTGSTTSDRRFFRVTNGDSIFNDRRNSNRPLARGDSRVKSLIETIECVAKQSKTGSRSSSTSSLSSNNSETNNNVKSQILKKTEADVLLRISPLKESVNTSASSPLRPINCNSIAGDAISPLSNRNFSTNLPDTVKMSQLSGDKISTANKFEPINKPVSILANKIEPIRKNSYGSMSIADKKDPLASLAQNGGSKRNALLKWCQNKTVGYSNVDITNFSSSWNDGLAFCAILHTYLPDRVNYNKINQTDKKRNFELAFEAAESVGIPTMLDINDMTTLERPSWQLVFNYVTSIFSHFET